MSETLIQAPAARRALRARKVTSAALPAIPDYLREVYHWAYLNPRNLAIFDHDAVVSAILWGNHGRLRDAVLAEIEPGQRVLEMACVYGDLSPALAARIGPLGSLDVIDVAPLQVDNCRRKLPRLSPRSARVSPMPPDPAAVPMTRSAASSCCTNCPMTTSAPWSTPPSPS